MHVVAILQPVKDGPTVAVQHPKAAKLVLNPQKALPLHVIRFAATLGQLTRTVMLSTYSRYQLHIRTGTSHHHLGGGTTLETVVAPLLLLVMPARQRCHH